MIAEHNFAIYISALFIITCVIYIFTFLDTIKSDIKSVLNQEYITAGSCVVFSSLFYGLMTITDIGPHTRIFWAIAYNSYFMFMPLWARFTFNMLNIKNKFIKFAARYLLIIISMTLAVLGILSDKVTFVQTRFGVQYNFSGGIIFKIMTVYVFMLCIVVILSHLRWWRESKMKRQRKQQYMFLLLTIIFAPLGYATDVIIPAFTSLTVIPLCSILLLPASTQLYISMRVNKTLGITVPNVSGYIFTSASIPIVVLDHINNISLENKAAVNFFGGSVANRNIADFILLNGKLPERAFFDYSFSSAIITVATPSGVRTCDMVLTVEYDKYNQAICKIIVLRDITESRELHSQLESALVKATAASKAKGDFLANMSHEIRTPMNAIIGMVHIGKSSDEPERKDYSLDRIADASKHLLAVINDVLDVSKIEAGKFELSSTDFNFEKLIQGVVNVIKFRSDEKNQVLSVNIDPDIPENFIGDDHRLAQVITNIAANAVKFTPDGGAIDISAQFIGEQIIKDKSSRKEKEMCTIQVSVSDTGIGINPEHIECLFDSFHQAETSTTRKFGGTGLGLSISKSIVEMMDGKIWVESDLGKGSRFIFTINLERGSGLKAQDTSAEQDDIDGTFEGRNILLVEDVEINREIVLSLLEPTLVNIDCAVNGAEAVRIFEESPDKYDMIFMDLQMPEMDGYEATRNIRALGTAKAEHVPIIAMTANVFKEDVERCIASGMNGHVGKPVDFNEVISRMRQYL